MIPSAIMDRRELFRFGRLCLLGSVPQLASRASAISKQAHRFGKAKSCILLFQVGGPYQCDTFDPKPSAPEEMRGPFRRIDTTVSGLHVTEALAQNGKTSETFFGDPQRSPYDSLSQPCYLL